MTRIFFIGFLASGIANFLFTVLILRVLSSAGIKIGIYELRWQVHKHLKTYQRLTIEKTGQVGKAYYGYWATLVLLGAFGILAVLSLNQ